MSTLIHITALLILIGRAGAYEVGNISGTEFVMSAIACFVIMAAGILIDRTREVRNQEDSGKEEISNEN